LISEASDRGSASAAVFALFFAMLSLRVFEAVHAEGTILTSSLSLFKTVAGQTRRTRNTTLAVLIFTLFTALSFRIVSAVGTFFAFIAVLMTLITSLEKFVQ